MLVLEIAVGVMGALVVATGLSSAVRTVVVPRDESVFSSRLVFVVVRKVFTAIASRRKHWEAQDAVMARFAPIGLMFLPVIWSGTVIVGFTAIFWSLRVRPLQDAFALSGSSLTTLGVRSSDDLHVLSLEIVEGMIGLGIFALLISFLPSIYGHFSRRELLIARLAILADGEGGPLPENMIIRLQVINDDIEDTIQEIFTEWEPWFIQVEESHVSFPMLTFFRSQRPDRSWITSSGLILDTAALYLSSVRRSPNPHGALLIRTGTVALRSIASFFDVRFDPDPAPDDRISIERSEYDAVLAAMEKNGVPLVDDRDQAWKDFVGWRVNYDAVLVALCALVLAPPARWSSDRGAVVHPMRVVRRNNPKFGS